MIGVPAITAFEASGDIATVAAAIAGAGAGADREPEADLIVEHVGLPRIDDFCYMATQEPNVYAGLAVVIGALMHARPRFFNRVMGELAVSRAFGDSEFKKGIQVCMNDCINPL